MLSNEQVQRIGELSAAKHEAGLAFTQASEELQNYLMALTEPTKPARKRRSDAGQSRGAQPSLTGLPDEPMVGE